jgi:hypothetical protein
MRIIIVARSGAAWSRTGRYLRGRWRQPETCVRKTKPRNDILMILGMALMIAIPAILTLRTVKFRPDEARNQLNPSPYGYTVSLLLFLFPVVVLCIRHLRETKPKNHRRALLWAAGVIAMMGFTLDTVFGHAFFYFKNEGATLGLRLPAWDWTTSHWAPAYLPIEEFAFYVFGALFVIATYLAVDDEWLSDYDPDMRQEHAKNVPRLLHISWQSIGWWLGFTGLGLLLKKMGPEPDGFPGYFLFVMTLGFLPTFLFARAIAPFVNWRAFAFAFAILLLISLMWEATLGVPYDWWNYQDRHMLGIRVLAWSALPLEAVLLWLVIAWDCIIAFELFRVYFHMERPPAQALLGGAAPGAGGSGSPHAAARLR